jgi:hypothetical protein
MRRYPGSCRRGPACWRNPRPIDRHKVSITSGWVAEDKPRLMPQSRKHPHGSSPWSAEVRQVTNGLREIMNGLSLACRVWAWRAAEERLGSVLGRRTCCPSYSQCARPACNHTTGCGRLENCGSGRSRLTG